MFDEVSASTNAGGSVLPESTALCGHISLKDIIYLFEMLKGDDTELQRDIKSSCVMGPFPDSVEGPQIWRLAKE